METGEEKGNGTLFWQNDTLTHLQDPHRKGLIAVAVVSLVSLVTTATLFTYLSYKLLADLCRCRRRQRQQRRQRQLHERPGGTRSEISLDLSFSMPNQRQLHNGGGPDNNNNNLITHSNSTRSSSNNNQVEGASQNQAASVGGGACQSLRNPFPFLIMSILAAECHTALGFSLNLAWVVRDGIFVGTPVCALQGWLNSMGILTSGIFYMCMATSSYLAIVWGYRPQSKTIAISNAFAWLLSIGLVFGGIISGRNGEEFGGWYVRANAWCWVNPKYSKERLWSCWAWVLFSIPYTCILYALIFWNLYRQKRSSSSRQLRGRDAFAAGSGASNLPSGYHPAFFVYPFVYIACTLPLAVVRIKQSMRVGNNESSSSSSSSNNKDTDVVYYCVAALLVASNGLWNTILWMTTIFISTPEDIHNAGLEPFTSTMLTPEWRRYGNMVWISGPPSKGSKGGKGKGGGEGPWWWWRMGGETRLRNSSSSSSPSQGTPSQEFLHRLEDHGIQLDVVTTITVEAVVDREKDVGNGRSPKHDKHDDTDSST